MKKDIEIPEVTGIAMAMVKEYNEIYKTDDWNVYLINNRDSAIEMVLIVSHGQDGETVTSKMRHKIENYLLILLLKLSWYSLSYSN